MNTPKKKKMKERKTCESLGKHPNYLVLNDICRSNAVSQSHQIIGLIL